MKRTLPLLLIVAALSLGQSTAQSINQSISVPPDPLDPVTGVPETPATPAERGALVVLINRAIDHYSLHARGTPAHVLQISFTASASTLHEGGAGQLRETWISGQNWRWDGSLAAYRLTRVSSNGAIFDQNPDSSIPLRIKMLAAAVFAPIEGAPRQETLRTAQVTWKGTPVTCILTSPSGSLQTAPTGARQWNEAEYCIDPAAGLLALYSASPGHQVVYDYTAALRFHDRVLPGRISITENEASVLDAQLTTIADTDAADASPFAATAQMVAQGPAIAMGAPFRMTLRLPHGAAADETNPPVTIHATLDQHGKVREFEALQNSAGTAAALDLVNKMTYGEMRPAAAAAPIEREAFITIVFQPQSQAWQFRHTQ